MNVSPALTPIPNQTIMAGQTLVITNLAGDVLAPPQVLSYALVTPPPGATINSLNGLLSWRPTIAQGGTTNVLTVVVSNNGQPVLSAIQNFVVNVLPPAQPAFAHYAISNGLFVSWIVGDSGPDYSLFRSTNLISWQLVSTTNQPAMPFQFVVPTVANRQDEYYRIRLGP
jgi:hypothetical protein